jgi:hypothetical protein
MELHFSEKIIVRRGIEVIQFNIQNIVVNIGGVKNKLLVPIGVQGFLDYFGLQSMGLSLYSQLAIRVRSSSQVCCFDSSCFHHFHKEARFGGLFLSLLLGHVSARHFG